MISIALELQESWNWQIKLNFAPGKCCFMYSFEYMQMSFVQVQELSQQLAESKAEHLADMKRRKQEQNVLLHQVYELERQTKDL